MAKGPTTVAAPKLQRTPMVRGTWPPQPDPINEGVQKSAQPVIKPQGASTRNYGKAPPLAGNTGLTGAS